MYVEKPSNPTNSSSSEHSVKLNNKERAIVNYLKLQKFEPTTTPPIVALIDDVEIAAATQIKGGVPVVKMILEDLEKKKIVKRDGYGNWALSARVDYLLKFKLENSNKLSFDVKSTSSKEITVVPNSEELKLKIELIQRNGKLFAPVQELKKHPLNGQIYSENNIPDLLEEIKRSRWIKTLVITPTGVIISGNSRYECAKKLGWKILPVEVREFKSEREENKFFLRENGYRNKSREEKTREGLLWEKITSSEARERRRATQKNKPNVDEDSDCANLHTQTKKSMSRGRASAIAAEKVGLKHRNYEQNKKVLRAIDSLKETGRTGAFVALSQTLNDKSTNAAYLQLEDLRKVELAIEAFKEKKQNDKAHELELALKRYTISEAKSLMDEWRREELAFSERIKVGDVVKIKTKLYLNQWGIVDTSDNQEFTCNLTIHQGEYRQVHKAELEPLDLSEKEQEIAMKLMCRLQMLWGQLDQLEDAQFGREVIKVISVKSLPILNRIENSALIAIEREVTEILKEQIKDRENE